MSEGLERIALLRRESERIYAWLQTLSDADWQRQSACDAWSNADVVGHTTLAVEMFAGNIARGLAGDSAPPEGMPAAGQSDNAARMAANATRAVDFRASLGDGLLAGFAEGCQRLDDLFAAATEADLPKPCYHPVAMLTVAKYVNLRLTELAVHEWDIRSSMEPELAQLPDETLPAIYEMLPGFVVGRLFLPGAELREPARFRFELNGALPARYDIIAGGGDARLEPAADEPAAVTFACDSALFPLLAYGRIRLADAEARGLLSVSGARELADQF